MVRSGGRPGSSAVNVGRIVTSMAFAAKPARRTALWGTERWAVGAIGSEASAIDALLHIDDCLEVLAVLTGDSERALVVELEWARSAGSKLELSCRVESVE